MQGRVLFVIIKTTMIFAHAFVGLIIAAIINPRFITSKRFPVSKQKLAIWGAAVIGSIIPDFDFVYVLLFDGTAKHRELISHSIFPYLLVLIIGIGIVKYKKLDSLYLNVIIAFVLGAFLHLVADVFADKVYFLNPISHYAVMIRPFSFDQNGGFLDYAITPYFMIELVIIGTGIVLLLKSYANYKKQLKYLLLLLGTIQIAVIIALMPFLTSFN